MRLITLFIHSDYIIEATFRGYAQWYCGYSKELAPEVYKYKVYLAGPCWYDGWNMALWVWRFYIGVSY